ncbi:hypothetical protein [Streptomyces sp. NPDC005780]|uniref:hypothetical protein n=1 Tax=Streptomyces sp. NPDC005780 TaxID=3364730 RepID=UPI0036CC1A21
MPRVVARSVPVVASMAILLVTSGAMFGALFVSTFVLRNSLGLDPLTTGLRVLPPTVLMVLGTPAPRDAPQVRRPTRRDHRAGPRRSGRRGPVRARPVQSLGVVERDVRRTSFPAGGCGRTN